MAACLRLPHFSLTLCARDRPLTTPRTPPTPHTGCYADALPAAPTGTVGSTVGSTVGGHTSGTVADDHDDDDEYESEDHESEDHESEDHESDEHEAGDDD